MYSYMYGSNWLWHGFFGPVFMVVFWVALIYLFVVFVRDNTTKNRDEKKAMDYLKERYAKGEITKEQFEHMKKDISNS